MKKNAIEKIRIVKNFPVALPPRKAYSERLLIKLGAIESDKWLEITSQRDGCPTKDLRVGHSTHVQWMVGNTRAKSLPQTATPWMWLSPAPAFTAGSQACCEHPHHVLLECPRVTYLRFQLKCRLELDGWHLPLSLPLLLGDVSSVPPAICSAVSLAYDGLVFVACVSDPEILTGFQCCCSLRLCLPLSLFVCVIRLSFRSLNWFVSFVLCVW